MIVGSPNPDHGVSIVLLEGSLTALAVAIAFAFPGLCHRAFTRLELAFARLGRRRAASVVIVGLSALLLRLALLPISPIPKPFIHDDFSQLLASDTFASGRLTNPTPAMWEHFESFHITMQPTYMSMYYPSQGLVLAAGKVLTGDPWYGLLVVNALMCAAICWMLQAWLPPGWALLGGLLAVLRLGLFSYWIDTYEGAGAIAAVGGALVLGALPRLLRKPSHRASLLLALGIIVLAMSRPYEGLLLCLPVMFVVVRWLIAGPGKPDARTALRLAAGPLALLLLAGSWTAFYNYRVFGNPLTQPYTVNRATYAIVPHFIWQQAHLERQYRHPVMRSFYAGWELDCFRKVQTVSGFATETPVKLMRAVLFFAGIAMLPPVIMLRRVVLDRRTRLLMVCLIPLTAGMLVETWLIPHYLAPFTAAFYVLGLQAARHLRVWHPGGKPVGLTLVRASVTICILLAAVRCGADPLHLDLSSRPETAWFGSRDFGQARAQVETRLEAQPGQQLVLVRYSPHHDSLDEWVYNAADIDGSKVIWAREMSPAEDRELLDYYKDRKVWLVEPDKAPASLSPYVAPEQPAANARVGASSQLPR
jgi:hypothetical protein